MISDASWTVFKPEEEIVIAYGKASGYSTTDINELKAIYRREIEKKLADFGFCLPPVNHRILRLSVLAELANLGQEHGKKFVLWLMPKVEDAEVFISMADNLTEATGALKCWANVQGFEKWEKDIPWRKITTLLWQQN